MNLQVLPLTAHLGAEIRGLDVSKPCPADVRRELVRAFHEHQLLLFRDQDLQPEHQIAFTRTFGTPSIHVLDQYLHRDYPEILVISNLTDSYGKTEGLDEADVIEWHSDFFWREQPSIGSLLYAVEVPPVGGDTLFSSMYHAWDRLPGPAKARVEGLRARRSLDYLTENERKQNPRKPSLTDEQRQNAPPVVHPLVRVHPATGKKSLFVSQMAIETIIGYTDSMKEGLLAYLFDIATQDYYRHVWRKGDLLLWDNRCTIHTRTPSDPKYPRILYRTTLEGEPVYESLPPRQDQGTADTSPAPNA